MKTLIIQKDFVFDDSGNRDRSFAHIRIKTEGGVDSVLKVINLVLDEDIKEIVNASSQVGYFTSVRRKFREKRKAEM